MKPLAQLVATYVIALGWLYCGLVVLGAVAAFVLAKYTLLPAARSGWRLLRRKPAVPLRPDVRQRKDTRAIHEEAAKDIAARAMEELRRAQAINPAHLEAVAHALDDGEQQARALAADALATAEHLKIAIATLRTAAGLDAPPPGKPIINPVAVIEPAPAPPPTSEPAAPVEVAPEGSTVQASETAKAEGSA